MNQKTITLILLFLCVSFTLYSQSEFNKGFLTTLKGDTLMGEIHVPPTYRSAKKILFRTDHQSQPTSYSPGQIKAFTTNAARFVSAVVEIETSPLNTSKLTTDNSLQFRTDTVFLQQLISGDKSLYHFISKEDKNQFYIKNGDDFELLIYKRYYKQGKIVDVKKYVGQLILYLQDFENIRQAVQRTEYKKKSMVKLFSNYYTNSGKEFKAMVSKKKAKIEYGALAGVSVTDLSFDNEEMISYISKPNLDPSVNPSFGLYADLIFARGKQKWSLYSDLLYTRMNFEERYYSTNSEHYYKYYDTEITYNSIRLTNMIRYKIPIQNSHLFLNAGISNAFVIEKTNTTTSTAKQYSSDKITVSDAFNDRIHEQGFVTGLGFKRKRLHLEIRYERTNGIVDLALQDSNVSRMYFLVGYQF